MRKIFMDVNPFDKNRGLDEESFAQNESYFKKIWNKTGYILNSFLPRDTSSWLIILLATYLLWQLLVSWSIFPSLNFPAVDNDKWQAIFLTTGQAYFGHLKEANKNYVMISDIYYLRTQTASQSQQTSQQPILIKLGDEIYGPEDPMYVPKSQIVFWENMKDASPVVQAIANQNKK